MDTFKINRNSWHYKLNHHFLNDDSFDMSRWEAKHNNFCSYWRATMFRVLFTLPLLALAGIFFSLVGMAMWENPVEFFIHIGVIILVAVTLVGVIGGVFWVIDHARKMERTTKGLPPTPPGLIKQKYISWKEKYCPAVEYNTNE